MAHIHPVQDAEAHFVIDPQTREITTEENLEQLIQGDHNSEVYSFEIPKAVDGHPMLSCNKIKVHYINIDSSTKAENKGAYEVTDIQELYDNTLVFTWLVSGNATKFQGPLSFLIEFSCLADDGTVDYRWNTGIFSSIPVGQGMSNTDELVLKYPDILEQWKNEVMGGGGVSSWNDLTDKPFGERTTYGDTLTWDGNTEGLEVANGICYRVSDIFPSLSDLQNGVSIALNGNPENETATVQDMTEMFGLESYMLLDSKGELAVMAISQNHTDEGVTMKKGLYFYNDGSRYLTSLTINGYNGFEKTETVPLPNKYLDIIETVGGDTLTWDGDASGLEGIEWDVNAYMYHVSDVVLTESDFAGGFSWVWSTGNTFTGTTDGLTILEGIILSNDYYWISIPNDNTDADGVIFPKKGIYFVNSPDVYITSLTINGYTGFTKEQVKEEYIKDVIIAVLTEKGLIS